MKLIIIVLANLAVFGAFIANAEAQSVGEIRLKQSEIISTNRWHGLTFNCHLEEADEIATTPGSPPLDVDDPSTPGCNGWEINIVMNGDFYRSNTDYELPLFDINYGIGDNLQIKYEVPNAMSNNRSNTLGDSKLGVKFQFYGNEVSRVQAAIYPQVQFNSPGGESSKQDLHSLGTVTTLPFLISRRLAKTRKGDVMLTANIGYNKSTRADTEDFVSAAVGVGAPLIRKSSILMELVTEQAFHRTADDPRQQLVKFDIGATVPLSKQLLVFALLGHSLIASDELEHTYLLTGFRWLPGE